MLQILYACERLFQNPESIHFVYCCPKMFSKLSNSPSTVLFHIKSQVSCFEKLYNDISTSKDFPNKNICIISIKNRPSDYVFVYNHDNVCEKYCCVCLK